MVFIHLLSVGYQLLDYHSRLVKGKAVGFTSWVMGVTSSPRNQVEGHYFIFGYIPNSRGTLADYTPVGNNSACTLSIALVLVEITYLPLVIILLLALPMGFLLPILAWVTWA